MKLHGIEIQKQELARLLGLHPNSITKMVRDDRLPPIVDEYCRVVSELKGVLGSCPVDKKRGK